MNDRTKAYIAICVALILIVVSLFAVIVKPAEARDVEPDWTWKVAPSDITNSKALREMRLEKLKAKIDAAIEQRQAEIAEEQAAWEAEQAAYYEQQYYQPTYYGGGIYYAEYSDAYNTDGPSHTMPGWYDGYLETYYNASSHYLAPTWTLDSEGFYHDENGRYVVGVEISHADEMPYGTVVQTGKGEGVVYDYGAGAEVHDFATNW